LSRRCSCKIKRQKAGLLKLKQNCEGGYYEKINYYNVCDGGIFTASTLYAANLFGIVSDKTGKAVETKVTLKMTKALKSENQ